MAIQIQGNGGVIAEISGTNFRAQHMIAKALEYGALGHYRVSERIVMTTAQAANSRLLVLRNPTASGILIVPTRLTIRALQIAAGTAQETSFDLYKLTSFTVLDTTNTVTPTFSPKRTTEMAASPTGQLRHLTLAGNSAGMTGATSTKGAKFATLPIWVNTAVPTAPSQNFPAALDCLDDVNGTHPITLKADEGIMVENRVLNATSFGMVFYFDISWAEVTAY